MRLGRKISEGFAVDHEADCAAPVEQERSAPERTQPEAPVRAERDEPARTVSREA
ncbi:hypothetical protein [Pseudonocardia phyllosphaerae]|uniref:hypothetical protein n=1 Tax=Pseudonocardia phyllosphaerae TaxID=3390502 RepID=UPI00397B32BA